MRTRTLSLIGALLLASAGVAQAQELSTFGTPVAPEALQVPAASQAPAAAVAADPAQAPSAPQMAAQGPKPDVKSIAPSVGGIDFGYRGSSYSGDGARLQRLNDFRDGPMASGFHYKQAADTWALFATANNVGYRDQQYRAKYTMVGKAKANFDWTSNPLFSEIATSLYSTSGSSSVVPAAVQQGLQAGTLTLKNAVTQFGQPIDVQYRRDVANADFTYNATRDVDLKVAVRNTNRNGTTLQDFGFGNSPGNVRVLDQPVPVKDRTTDLNATAEWANKRGQFGVGYAVSWYNQSNPAYTFANPYRSTDSATAGPAMGQAALWPSNDSNTVNVNGAVKFAGRSKAFGMVSYGVWSQNEPLVPNTVNTALVSPPLERTTAEAKADIATVMAGVNSRPIEDLTLDARYRFYDYSNKTAPFTNTVVTADFAIGALTENEIAGYKRQSFDADASYAPHKYINLGVGYSYNFDQQDLRVYTKTGENTFRAQFDTTGNQYVTLRMKYEYSKRDSIDYNPENLPDSEQPLMVQFDVAPRDRNRGTAILTVTPISTVAFNATYFVGRDKYPTTYFGLRNNDNDGYSFGVDILPAPTVTFSVNGGRETYKAFQWSRTANPLSATDVTFNDPRRDWNLTTKDGVTTFSSSLDLNKTLKKTDVRLSYDLSDGNTNYLYGLVPATTLAITQYTIQPKNRTQVAKVDATYFVTQRVGVGASYWYQQYSVQDFALNPALVGALALGSDLYNGYTYAPYKANTVFVRMTYLW